MGVFALLYLLAMIIFFLMMYFWGENLHLKQKMSKHEDNTLTKWDMLVGARKSMVDVNIKEDLNIDQLELWTNFVKLYCKEIIENERNNKDII